MNKKKTNKKTDFKKKFLLKKKDDINQFLLFCYRLKWDGEEERKINGEKFNAKPPLEKLEMFSIAHS